jgi:hypothetical protein
MLPATGWMDGKTMMVSVTREVLTNVVAEAAPDATLIVSITVVLV